ncbi:MAG: hypothetical protein H6Q89_4889 [Myxococcaceae bacterium]|nr:hypothetical protein [Myxococcaceae bacterium]
MRLALVCLAVGLVGCATTYNANWAAPETATSDDGLKAALEEGDALWQQRGDQARLQAAIDKWEAAATRGSDAALFTRIARGHHLLADLHGVEGNPERRDSEYQLGLDWATRALKLAAPDFAKAMGAGQPYSASIGLTSKDAVPAAYWYAANLEKWAASRGFATRILYKDDIKATMEHLQKLDEGFFAAAPYRHLGSYEALTEGLAGGSLERSEAHFKKGVELAPAYLGTKVLWAKHLCVKKEDRLKFTELLQEVIAADPAVDPELEAENRLEQQKAKQLLAEIDELF